MRLSVSLLGLASSCSSSVSRQVSTAFDWRFLLLASLVACNGTLGVGEPLPEKTPPKTETSPPSAPVTPVLPAPGPGTATYTWKWAHPQGTGVALRGAFTLPSGETWIVGDDGTVLREVAGVAKVMRVGVKDEVLTAAWGRGPDDMWVGGARGTGGVLTHWNGKKWSDSYPIATLPIDALQGLPNGNLVVVTDGAAKLMHPEGSVLQTCGGSVQFGFGLSGVRDVWVQTADEVWLAGEGVARWKLSESACVHLDDRPTLGIWGDGANRIVVASRISNQVDYELRERTANGFATLGTRFGGPQREVRGGRALAGDPSGRIRVLLHGKGGGDPDSYVTYNPAKGTTTETLLTVSDPGDHGPLYGEVLYGLTTSGAQTTFVGDRGLRGRFDQDAVLPLPFRRSLERGIASPDGTTFARCTNAWEFDTTSICRWDATSGWSELPKIEGYCGYVGVAPSATSLLVGGWTQPSTSPTTYRTRSWNGTSWSEGPQRTNYLFSPLFTTGPNDIWAWSDYDTVHFDGRAWSIISHGGPGTGGIHMIDGLASNDVWLLDQMLGLSRWDGTKLTKIASLPTGYVARELPRGLLAVEDGAWLVGAPVGVWPQSNRLLHWNGKDWTILELPGVQVRSLARGPDGKVRMLAAGNPTRSVYIVEDSGITKELDLPDGIIINDIFAAGKDLFAVGEMGATLKLTKVDASSTR